MWPCSARRGSLCDMLRQMRSPLCSFLVFSACTAGLWAESDELTYLPTGPGPYWISAADLDGDGETDLFASCRGELLSLDEERPANDTATLYLSGRRSEVQVGFGPYTSEVADLDGDGLQDVVVANFHEPGGRDLTLLYGGAFDEPVHVAVEGEFEYDKSREADGKPRYPAPGLTSVKAADFNQDGRMDLVAVAWSSDFIVVFTNLGERRFRQERYPTLPGPRDIAVADVDRDGKDDLVVTIYSSNLVAVWLQKGAGRFARSAYFSSQGATPYHLRLGDLDGDGWTDLVVGNRSTSDNVAVFHNRKGLFEYSGSFSPGTVRAGESTADEIRDVLLADVNRDGVLDLLAAGHVSHKVVWWEGTGIVGFGAAFAHRRVLEMPGKGPRALADDGERVMVALYDSDEIGLIPKLLLRGLPAED